MKYETPKMAIIIFDSSDIAADLQAGSTGTGADPSEDENLDFGNGFN